MIELSWVGFITELDANHYAALYADFVAQLVDAPAEAVAQAVAQAVAFLSRGTVLFATMGFFRDLETGQSVAPKLYYTDGQWVWPSYLAHYLHKRQQLLPSDFYAHIQARPGSASTRAPCNPCSWLPSKAGAWRSLMPFFQRLGPF